MPPPGLLRVLVAFHEPELLGAGTSVLRAVSPIGEYGWTVVGWVPGDGPLRAEAERTLASVEGRARPFRFSAVGWRTPPGVRARLTQVRPYLASFGRTLLAMRPHVVHANTLLAAPEALTARRLGLPVVVHVHEAPPPGLKLRAAVRLAARAADVFVCVSEAAAATVRPHAGRTPVHVVRNGAPELERVVRGGRGPFTVGTVATVSRTKGTDVLYRAVGLALERRPSLRFVHAGQSDLHEDRRLDVELRGLLDDTALGAATTRLGFVPAAEVLPRLDAFVLASRSEAFPLATLEAMSAGVPVVAADVGGLREQIRHLEDGLLVPAGDERALADALVRLHDDTGLRGRLAAAARARVRRELTLERQAAGLHAAYLAALDLRFGPPVVRARAKAFRGGQSA